MTQQGMKVGDSLHPVVGTPRTVGDAAPDFVLTAINWQTHSLADFAGKVKVLSCVPSLDTPVCSTQTRRFNAELATLPDDIVVITISADTPFAQYRWSHNESDLRTVVLSDHKAMQFAEEYGLHDTEWRVLQRAAFVLDRDNVIRYAEYVADIDLEPNYDAVLDMAKSLV